MHEIRCNKQIENNFRNINLFVNDNQNIELIAHFDRISCGCVESDKNVKERKSLYSRT